MRLGNIQFNEVESKLGYRLDSEDEKMWNKYHCNRADLNGKVDAFHVFDIPRCIVFKGKSAKNAILKMFQHEKITGSMGKFHVYEQKS